MEKKKTANKAAKKPAAKKAPAKKAAPKAKQAIKLIGIKAPLEEGKEYFYSEASAKILIDKGVAKKA